MKRYIALLLSALLLVLSACSNYEDVYDCNQCGELFVESDMTYIEHGDEYLCYRCAYIFTVDCGICGEAVLRSDWYDNHEEHWHFCCSCETDFLTELVDIQDEYEVIHTICPECYNYKYFKLNPHCGYHD